LALDRLARGGGWAAFGASAGLLALVVLGHNITALFFVGLASIYAVLVAVQHGLGTGTRARGAAIRVARVARVVGAVGLALALAAIYWLPALTELHFSRVSEQR